jgi:DNA-binding GntR family transcriptional regulator
MPISPLINPQSLERTAYNVIKDAILTFHLQPGEPLVETTLAAQLGISKTPVRDALARLEREGLVVKISYKGTTVAPVTRQSVLEIFQIRAALEGLAARLAAPRLTNEDLELLRRSLLQHAQALANADFPAAASSNRIFHKTILQRANNARLGQILANLEDHSQRFRLLSNYQQGRLEKSVQEHQRIFIALEKQDPPAAEEMMRAHLLSVASDLADQDFDQLAALVLSQEHSPSATMTAE